MNFRNKVKKIPGVNKNKGKEILKIVSNIRDFSSNEQNQIGVGLKILILNQFL